MTGWAAFVVGASVGLMVLVLVDAWTRRVAVANVAGLATALVVASWMAVALR